MVGEVGLSAPTCYRRIHRLRTTGAIERKVAIVDPPTVGRPLFILVMVTLKLEDAHTISEMMRLFGREAEGVEAWNVTGDQDLVGRIVARDIEGYDELVQRLFAANDHVRGFKTLAVIREIKSLSLVPVVL